ELVHAGHRDDEMLCIGIEGQVPGRGKWRLQRFRPLHETVESLVAGARYRANRARSEIYFTQQVILRIRNIERAVRIGKTLRTEEAGIRKIAVLPALPA